VTLPNNGLADFRFHIREQQIAGFANLTYAPIPALKVTAGLRESYAPGFYKQNLSGFFTGAVGNDSLGDQKPGMLFPPHAIGSSDAGVLGFLLPVDDGKNHTSGR